MNARQEARIERLEQAKRASDALEKHLRALEAIREAAKDSEPHVNDCGLIEVKLDEA